MTSAMRRTIGETSPLSMALATVTGSVSMSQIVALAMTVAPTPIATATLVTRPKPGSRSRSDVASPVDTMKAQTPPKRSMFPAPKPGRCSVVGKYLNLTLRKGSQRIADDRVIANHQCRQAGRIEMPVGGFNDLIGRDTVRFRDEVGEVAVGQVV